MKKIRIFIGSSLVELEKERDKLMTFIQGLNNKYLDRGIFIEGYICENTPNNMRIGGSQKMHNDYINNQADATIFMFFHKAGEFTIEELKLAREAFLEKGLPNVFVFFKAVEKGMPDVNEEIQSCLRLVFDDFGHYYKVFDDVDTIKLELLQFLVESLPGKGEIMVKDDQVYVNGEAVEGFTTKNIFAYQNNPDLQRLKQQIEVFEKQMVSASEKGDMNTALKISAKLEELRKEYRELETGILNMIMLFHRENRKGGKADPTMAEALRQLELGNIELAKILIPQEALDTLAASIAEREALAEEQLHKDRETLIARTEARIRTLEMDVGNPGRFEEIEQAYETAYEAAKASREYDFIYEFARFLCNQRSCPKGIRIAEKLRHIYDDPENANGVTDSDYARLLNLMGRLYVGADEVAKGEACFGEVLKIERKIYMENPLPESEKKVAIACNNLANLYADTGRWKEAEELYLEALSILRGLSEKDEAADCETYIASFSNNLANLYAKTGKLGKAEEFYLDALLIRSRLAEKVNNVANEAEMAGISNNLANLYKKIGNLEKAEKLYLEALSIRRRLAKKDSAVVYETEIMTTCSDLAHLYYMTGRRNEAEDLYLKTLSICRRLTEEVSTEGTEAKKAGISNGLANLYKDAGRVEEAEKLYLEALSIYMSLAKEVNRDAYESDLARICNNLAGLYYITGKLEKAEKLYLKALSIHLRLTEEVSAVIYEPYVATTCAHLAMLYTIDRPKEAEMLLGMALSIYRKLVEEVSAIDYEPYLAATLSNYGVMLEDNDRIDEAKKCFAEAKELAEKYKDNNALCRQLFEKYS